MNHADLVRELSDQLVRLHSRAEAAEADARRYRKLKAAREEGAGTAKTLVNLNPFDWDAAIDAELAKEPKP